MQNDLTSTCSTPENAAAYKNSFPHIEQETRTAIPTNAAAFYLNRSPQTLRSWACYENGPIRPVRINGRLAWPVSEIRRILTGEDA